MIRRVYLIQLRPDLSEARIDSLVKVLHEAPNHIPGLIHSRAHRENSRNVFDLVWDHTFEDVFALKRYMVHPYHSNLIDEFLYHESPSAVVQQSMAVEWDDAQDFSLHRADTSPPALSSPYVAPPYVAPASNVPLTLVEHLEISPDLLPTYLQQLRKVYLPMVEPYGLRLQGILRSIDRSDHCVLLWSVQGWEAVAQVRHSIITGGGLDVWRANIHGLVTGGVRRYMVSVPAPVVDDNEIQFKTTLLLYETVLPMDTFREALKELGDRASQVSRPGVRLTHWLRSPDHSAESTSTMLWELGVERPSEEAEIILSTVRGSWAPASAIVLEPVYLGR